MQNTVEGLRPPKAPDYRERLSPSIWLMAAAAVCAPMVALVIAPVDLTLALVVGVLAGVLIIAVMIALSPVVAVEDGRLRAGRARIDVSHLGDPLALTGDEARRARGQALDPRSWHVIRGGIDGVVTVPIEDPADPAPSWVISTRTPERVVAAIRRAKVRQRTPGT